MLLSILFLFLNSTDIPTKQVPETKYAILSYILKLRIKRACRTVSTFLLIEFQKYKSKKYLRQ